nr:glutaredoxin domain-containing cysteine-rich protein 1 [Misgurnus anguillicaudatus]
MFNRRMERRASLESREEDGGTQRRVRFRVASARSGRVLQEVFSEFDAHEDSADTDTSVSSEPERASSPAISEVNSHLSGLEPDDSGGEQDELLMYASARQEKLFTGKRVKIFSKNGTIRGVRDKVSAGQVLFNNLSKMYADSLILNRPKRH